MLPGKPVKRRTARQASGRDGNAVPEPGATRPPEPERRYVDVDPWAMLLEQLMEGPTEDAADDGGIKDRREARAQPEAGSALEPKRPKKRKGGDGQG